MKLTDFQWVNIGFQIPVLLNSGTVSGKLHRLLGAVFAKTQGLREGFDKEFADELKTAGDPLFASQEWVDLNVKVSKSFGESSTELDVPEFMADWFDEVKFAPGQYEIFKVLMK